MNQIALLCFSSMIKRIAKLANRNDLSFNQIVVQCCEYALSNLDAEEDNN